jgi:hypothetical protein
MALLGVDLGLKTGLAYFTPDGRLAWYRSHNYGTPARLKRGVFGLLSQLPNLNIIVVEGGGTLSRIWEREAHRRQAEFQQIAAEHWRDLLLLPREQKSGPAAKRFAEQAARRVIAWSKLPKPTALRHDAAEAILIGLWGVLANDRLQGLPSELHIRYTAPTSFL